ncbi:beta-ketoacyl synthase N-terminal-like domain-containing protein [Legionella rowbothamii]|uniref:beta-ketoacyl synthase N-terminal-like domain-containing protein n=1 Tax=Legionella rowbothamii TaxID=96229 RepID=UPI0010544BBB|nr:beta-ketoacyl synthase N-terminal-like domain-containing protein [Legionella rowbothamii]
MTDTTTLKNALLMIKKLKKKLQEQQEKLFDPIAIIGMSCRLPQARNLQEFWDLLKLGKNIITPIPEERWELLKETQEKTQRNPNLAYWGGYLADIDAFDAYFFGISPREALRMDPQQRLLLEVAYESLEDAGLTLDNLTGSNTGVFSSLYASQFSHLQQLDSDMDALLIPTGSAISMGANRISYILDLHGPSMVLDTACSSSLIAVQLACLNLQAKLCDQALVSAVNINLLPSIHAILAKATMLSPTGQCHTFDAQADGYVQGEGAGAIVLKPLSRALQDKDKIYAVITGSAVNQDGKTNGLTAPNGLQQEQLLRDAYRHAQTDPAHISYIECHGTGTFLGDPIEAQALGEVIGKRREEQKPCWISSVKTNVGHLEPAAGIISMIKTALILKNGVIPPHLNFQQANPHIPFAKYHLSIPQKPEPLPRYGEVAVAGVSGFGFGGANAHIVLHELSLSEQFVPAPGISGHPELFTLSAKDAGALKDLISLWQIYLKNNSGINLGQLCYNLHLRRSHYPLRLAIISNSIADLSHKLTTLSANPQQAIEGVFINFEAKKNNNAAKISEFSDVTNLAISYVSQASIDWKKYEEPRSYAAIDLPLYPWQHKKYWPRLGPGDKHEAVVSYPLRGKMLASPLSLQQFEFVFDHQALPEIQDSFYVLHAGYYLEMLAYAAKQLAPQAQLNIQELSFSSPLLVLAGKTVWVQLIIESTRNNQPIAFSFYSSDNQKNWIKNALGILSLQPESSAQALKDQELPHQYHGTAESFYQRIINMGMPAGDSIRWTEQFWTKDRKLLSELRAPKITDRSGQFMLQMHPGIIDACIQTLFLLLPQQLMKPYIASQIGQITIHRHATPKYIYTVLKELPPEGKTIIGDWYLLDEQYQVLMKCANLCMTQLNDTMQIDKMMHIQAQFQWDASRPFTECKTQLIEYLTEQFAIIFAMPVSDVNIHLSLHDLGMDSLMALAVIRVIEANLGLNYSLPFIMQGPSIQEIVEQILVDKNIKPQTAPAAAKNNSLWLASRKIKPEAKLRLFCFPYGGGGASIYREWQQEFPDFIEVCPIQLPGRENRMRESPITNIDTLIPLLATELRPYFDLPFAFFGHSFGSLISFELTRYLRRHHLDLPVHLFASAYPDPRLPSKSLDNLLHTLKQMQVNLFDLDQERLGQLDEHQLSTLAMVFRDNGIVDYSDERMNKSIIQVLLPIFVGDMNIVKSYTYIPEPPLQLATTVFLGQQDTWVSPEDHQGWSTHSLLGCEFKSFNSGHLFIREKEIRTQVIHKITEALCHFNEVAYELGTV